MGMGEAASTKSCLVPPGKQAGVPAGTEGTEPEKRRSRQ